MHAKDSSHAKQMLMNFMEKRNTRAHACYIIFNRLEQKDTRRSYRRDIVAHGSHSHTHTHTLEMHIISILFWLKRTHTDTPHTYQIDVFGSTVAGKLRTTHANQLQETTHEVYILVHSTHFSGVREARRRRRRPLETEYSSASAPSNCANHM